MKKKNRIVYRVKWIRRFSAWHIWKEGIRRKCGYNLKRDAIINAVWDARIDWQNGKISQVVIHKKDGKIQTEWTYGKDPRRTKG